MSTFANQLRDLADLIELDLPDVPPPHVGSTFVSWHLLQVDDPEPMARSIIAALGGEWSKPRRLASHTYIVGRWHGLSVWINLPIYRDESAARRDWSGLTQDAGVTW